MNRAARLWFGIRRRCDPAGGYVKERPTYIGCTNAFASFDEFRAWAENQPGFYRKDRNGKWWQLDKDLIQPGCKSYSPSTCIFVPAKINSLLVACNATRGEWPLGVYLDTQRGRWKAQCSDGSGKSKHIGHFDCPTKAHRAWQKYKATLVMDFAMNDPEVALEPALKSALTKISESIMSDFAEGRETVAMTAMLAAPSANSEQARSCVTCNGVGIIGHSTLCPECAAAPSANKESE